jgi:hypothetical protein
VLPGDQNSLASTRGRVVRVSTMGAAALGNIARVFSSASGCPDVLPAAVLHATFFPSRLIVLFL